MRNHFFLLCLVIAIWTVWSCGPSDQNKNSTEIENTNPADIEKESPEIVVEDQEDSNLDVEVQKESADNKQAIVKETNNMDAEAEDQETDIELAPHDQAKRALQTGEEGEVIYAMGDRLLYRDGDVIYDVDPGLGIESYDTLQTGDDGLVEVEMRSVMVPKSQITIHENTSFTFSLNIEDASKASVIELAAGYIEVAVDNLANDEDLEVRTASATLGVRGTTFTVTSLPSGDTLVTCIEGRVECSDDDASLNAIPGQVVEKSGSLALAVKKVPVNQVEAYRDSWYEEKIRLLREDALTQIKKNAAEYEKRLDQFKTAYIDLMGEKTILDKWVQEDKKNTQGTMVEVLKEKKAIIGHLQDIKQTLFWFEAAYMRLLKIKKYHDQGYGKGDISPGYSTTDFFNDMMSQKLEDKLADVKYVFKLYAKRNNGSVPVGGLSDPFDFANDDLFNF